MKHAVIDEREPVAVSSEPTHRIPPASNHNNLYPRDLRERQSAGSSDGKFEG